MGFWSKLKKFVKKAWKAVKSVVRQIVRIVIEVVSRIIGIFDLFLGFLGWPPKKLRLHVFILRDENGVSLMDLTDSKGNPLFTRAELDLSIEHLRKTLKDRMNIKLKAYSKDFVEVITESAPTEALEVGCSRAWLDEVGEAGNFFAKHLAGWNIIPITVTFPITAFVVRDVKDKIGCSLGPLTDYVTIDPTGVKSESTLSHEVGHSCGLLHFDGQNNLMNPNAPRGNNLKWWQKNLFRGSRHVQYW